MSAVEEIVDRLYGLPLAEFTQARNEAARELRKAGRREAADQVKALRKPTAAAAAANLLVREHRAEVEQFLRAAAALRDAQLSGKGDLAAVTRQEQQELRGLTRIGGEAVRQTLLAAAVDDDAARQLLEARLERELEPRGFGTLSAYAPAPASRARAEAKPDAETRTEKKPKAAEKPKAADKPMAAEKFKAAEKPKAATAARTRPAPTERKKPDDSAARARLEDAENALKAAEAEERQARRHWEQTQKELDKARAAVEAARRDLDRVRDR